MWHGSFALFFEEITGTYSLLGGVRFRRADSERNNQGVDIAAFSGMKTGASSKPGSVVDDHLSEERLAAVFMRPYPRVGGQPRPLLFGLAPGGVFLA